MKYFFIVLCTLSIQSNAQVLPAASNATKGVIHFTPTSFSNKFSLNTNPVLTISNGDTISTETIDAMGFDKNGVKRQRGGNPLTGPFYIGGALPGDVLAI